MPGPSWSVKSRLTLSMLLCAGTVHGGDPEHVSVQTVFSPRVLSYQPHAVTVEGVRQDLQVRSPFESATCRLDGRAAFLLEDGMGIIPVHVLGTCHPHGGDVLPHTGDHVHLTGLVQVLQSEAPRHVRIQALTIQILESTPER